MSWTNISIRFAAQAIIGGLIAVCCAASIAGINAWGAEHNLTSIMNAGVITVGLGVFLLASALAWSEER